MGANTFEIEVVLGLCLQFKDAPLVQAILTNLEVILSDELITQLNDSIEGYASVGGHAYIGQHATVGGHVLCKLY